MALRVVVASAVVSRKVGRGRHRLGAFSLGAYRPFSNAPPSRTRQRDHLRRRASLHGADAARPGVRGGVRPVEDRRRAPRRRLRRRCAVRRHSRWAGRREVRAEASRRRGASPALRGQLRVRAGRQRARPRRGAVHPGRRQHGDLGRGARLDLRQCATRSSRRDDRDGLRRRHLRRGARPRVRRARGARRDRACVRGRRRC